MPEFTWRAAAADGHMLQGHSEAATADDVLRQLRERGLTPIRVDQAAGSGSGAAGVLRRSRRTSSAPVKAADVLAFSNELAIMLRAGLALDSALNVLIEMSAKPSVRTLLEGILSDVKGGAPFSRALDARRKYFGDFYINMVRSGEVGGQMPQVLERLVAHLQRLRSLRESVKSALAYPSVLLAVALISLIGMLGFVVPQFEQLFQDMGQALPLPTRAVMAMSHALRHYGWLWGILAAVLGWALWRWLASPGGQAWRQRVALRLPILGRLIYNYEITLFARSLGTLLIGGVPLLTALEIACGTVGNANLRAPLEKMAPLVKGGGRITAAMNASGIFEPLAINLARVGEETGRIGPMMLELAQVLDGEVETGIRRALTMLEPLLIITLGLLIAGIIVSILMGILSINSLAG